MLLVVVSCNDSSDRVGLPHGSADGSAGSCGGASPLIGTWRSTSVGSNAMRQGVLSLVYTPTFGADMSFSATLQQTFGSGSTFAGCRTNTTITGGTWSAVTSGSSMTFSVESARAETTRSGCDNPSNDTSSPVSDSSVQGNIDAGEDTFVIIGSTMTVMGDTGIPYDEDEFVFECI